MAINREAMSTASKDFLSVSKNLPPERQLLLEGPLSRGLSNAHSQFGDAAIAFVQAKNSGIDAFGRSIDRIAAEVEQYDREGEVAIRRLFAEPPPPPETAEGQ